MWRIYCSSHIFNTSWYGVHPVSIDVAYFSYLLMWHTIYRISWCGVYVVLEIHIAFPDVAYTLYFLMWHTSCISWCGVHYIVSPDLAYILFFRHTYHFLICRTSCIAWCSVLVAFPGVAYNTLYHLAAMPLKSFPVSRHFPEMPAECQTSQIWLPLTPLTLHWHCAGFNSCFHAHDDITESAVIHVIQNPKTKYPSTLLTKLLRCGC